MQDAIDTVQQLNNLVKASAKRVNLFNRIQLDMAADSDREFTSLKPLCPTRWTVRFASLKAVDDNFDVLNC